MSRLIKTDSIAGERRRLARAVVFTIREMAMLTDVDEGKLSDMAAFLVLALEAIWETVERSVLPWEKRDYWLKADQFRREWSWTTSSAAKIKTILVAKDWIALPPVIADLGQRLGNTDIPKRHRLGEPWQGALQALREKGGLD